MTDQDATTLEELLDRIDQTTEGDDQVSMGEILDVVGRRSFGPLLLLPGLITVLPLVGDIPGVPTIMGIFVLLVAVQLLFHRDHLWLPGWLLDRSVEPDKLHAGLEWIRRPAEFIDRWLERRLTNFTESAAAHGVALACLVVALAMPVMEVIPFSANLAGVALTGFGLALIARDGLLALIAFAFTGLSIGVVVYGLL